MATTETINIGMRSINLITEEIIFYKHQAGAAIIEIGNRLIEAKEQLKHGEWLPWLEEKIDFSEKAATNFMRIAREYSNQQSIADLGTGKALALLALPASERDDFIEEIHEVKGEKKTVSNMTTKELETAVRERTEAIKLRDEANTISVNLQKRTEELEVKLSNAETLEKEAKIEADKLVIELGEAQRELAELKDKALTSASEPDKEALENLRKEITLEAEKAAEEKVKEKIDKALADKKDADAKLAAAQADCKTIEEQLDIEKKQALLQIESLQRQLAITSSEHTTIFKTHFDNAQVCINKMTECIGKLKEEDETCTKLTAALKTLCEKTIAALP